MHSVAADVNAPLKGLIIALVCGLLAACAKPPAAIVGVDGSSVSAFELPDNTLLDVFVATTRARAADPRVLFSGERDTAVSFARVTVSIPPNHEVGQIERPDTAVPDPRRHFAILEPVLLPTASAFTASVDEALAGREGLERDVLIFVHGYNTDMTSAILRTAQFAHDAGFAGIPVVFSWASAGQAVDYVYDLNSAFHARDGLLEAGAAMSRTKARGFNVVAHSMGNMLTVEALRQASIANGGTFPASFRAESITLAAPDIDLDLFRKQLTRIPTDAVPIYILTSADDRALAFSSRIAGGVRRVGAADTTELEDLGVIVVDLSAVADRETISHTKFANSPQVVQAIGAGLRAGNTLRTRTDTGYTITDLASLPVRILSGGRVVVFE